MKVKYLGKTSFLECTQGKNYDVISIEEDEAGGKWYRIVDDSDDDYLYPTDDFEVVEP